MIRSRPKCLFTSHSSSVPPRVPTVSERIHWFSLSVISSNCTKRCPPPTDLEQVVNAEIKCVFPAIHVSKFSLSSYPSGNGISVSHWNESFPTIANSSICCPCVDIYFHQNNGEVHHVAFELRDAVLRLRRDGAFVAVPLFRVNTGPVGPHPVGERLS